MIIAPLIFLVIVTGIAAVGDVKSVGRVGVKALIYFTAATGFALVFGLVVANLVQPGTGGVPAGLGYCINGSSDAAHYDQADQCRLLPRHHRSGCSHRLLVNLDGAAMYLSISLLFLAQAFGHDLSLGQQLAALGVLLLTSKGMAGVPGSSFLALSATAAALGIFPVAGVALMLGADRLMDSMRVAVNLLGNCVATFVVAKWEKQFDRDAMVRAFAGEITNEASSLFLNREDEFEEDERERAAQGLGPAPRYAGGPSRDEYEAIHMVPLRKHGPDPDPASASASHSREQPASTPAQDELARSRD
jgi:hypothetical protein